VLVGRPYRCDELAEAMAARDLGHRLDRLTADPLAEPLAVDDNHQCRDGGGGRTLAQPGDSVFEHRVDAAVREGLWVPVPADRDAVADRDERLASLVE
jgi:hypothetical protein